jgi:hypothetical protein
MAVTNATTVTQNRRNPLPHTAPITFPNKRQKTSMNFRNESINEPFTNPGRQWWLSMATVSSDASFLTVDVLIFQATLRSNAGLLS